MPSLPAWNPRTVSLPLSGGLSTVFPRLIPWLIQMTLAAQPIPGNRWVLWRLRPHPGICTPAAYQLRRSCVAACWSNVVRRYPVRSLHPLAGGWLGPAGSMDRSVWSILHPLRLSHPPYAAGAVYTPPNWAAGRRAFTLYDFHGHLGARAFHPWGPFPGMLPSPSSCEVSKLALAGRSRCVQEISRTPGRRNRRSHSMVSCCYHSAPIRQRLTLLLTCSWLRVL